MKQAICLLDDVSFLTYKKKYDILEVHEDGVMIIDDSNERCVLFDGEFTMESKKLIDILEAATIGTVFIIWTKDAVVSLNYRGLEYLDEDIDLESEVSKEVLYPPNGHAIYLKGYKEGWRG